MKRIERVFVVSVPVLSYFCFAKPQIAMQKKKITSKWRYLNMLQFGGVLLLFFAIGCSTKSKDEKQSLLSEIESLGNSSPKSALDLLKNVEDRYMTTGIGGQMAYRLLRVRLQDKSNIMPESEREMQEVCEYYEQNGSPEERMEAYYYMASVARDLHDSPKAVFFFLNAIQAVEECTDVDSAMWANAYSQLAALWRRQYRYAESIEAARKSCGIAEQAGILDPIYTMDVVTASNLAKDTANVLSYSNKTLDLICAEQAFNTYQDVVAELLCTYKEYGEDEKAKMCCDMLRNSQTDSVSHNYWLALGKYYEWCDRLDSATVCYQNYIGQTKASRHTDAARALSRIYGAKGNYAEAYRYALLYEEATDSVEAEYKRERADNAANEFQYYRDIEAENAAYREAGQSRTLLFAVIIAAIVLVFVVYYMYAKRKYQMEHIIQERTGRLLRNREHISELEKEIEKQEGIIMEREKLLREKEEEISALGKEVANEKKRYEKAKDSYRRLYTEAFNSEGTIDGLVLKDSLDKVMKGREKMTEELWGALFTFIDNKYPEFESMLRQKVENMTENKQKAYYLLKFGCGYMDISAIMKISLSTAWRRAEEMKEMEL